MKARVISRLNKRLWPSTKNTPLPNPLNPNDVVDITTEIDGEAVIATNSKWYKTDKGFYVWSGGVEPIKETPKLPEVWIDYNGMFENIPDEWRASKGSNTKVAVLDSGIFAAHPNLGLKPTNVLDLSRSKYNGEDRLGHGTHCAGLIGASAKTQNGVSGIAPSTEIISIKTRHETFKYDETTVANAILKSISLRVNVISMSFKLAYSDSNELKDAILKAKDEGIILVAAAGDNEVLTRNEFNKPAFFDNVISVGAVDFSFNNSKPSYNSKLNFILPLAYLNSTTIKENQYYEVMRGSSMATALVSGIILLLLDSDQSIRTKTSVINSLNSFATQIENLRENDKLKLFKI